MTRKRNFEWNSGRNSNGILYCSDSGIGNNYNDSITNQLLDLSIDSNQTAEHTVNFNNNSLITSAPLVTSDSHEAKGNLVKD